MANRKVAVIVGGLSKEALSGRIARALMGMQTPGIEWQRVEIGGLPFYNQDLETASPPQPWVDFRDAIRAADGILFVTPEYNRGPPGALKNAIDVGSRPPPQNVWKGKPCAIVSTSGGAIGGYGANHVLRQNISYSDMPVLLQPEMYVGHADKMLDADGKPTDAARDYWAKFLQAFAAWVDRHAPPRQAKAA